LKSVFRIGLQSTRPVLNPSHRSLYDDIITSHLTSLGGPHSPPIAMQCRCRCQSVCLSVRLSPVCKSSKRFNVGTTLIFIEHQHTNAMLI